MTALLETIAIGYSAILAIEFVSGLIELWKNAGTEPDSPTLEIPTQESSPAPESPQTSEPALEELPTAQDSIPAPTALPSRDRLMEMLTTDYPMTLEELRELARLEALKGWKFFRKQESLKAKLCTA